jgi:Family of unknown function (DUF6541)
MTDPAAASSWDIRHRRDPEQSKQGDAPRLWPRTWSSFLAGALYLGLGFALWWHAWGSPSGVMTCDCTDAGRVVWYLEWIPFALGQGHSPLFSTFQFHPHGFNLLDDTSVPAVGFLFSPVTELFGPVVSINVVSTLVPPATAFSMYWFLRRFVRWAPAAFVGGLGYGFSAWVVVQLAFGWINLACVALLPLMAACLDDLLIRQRRRPAVAGSALALLFVIEFFVSIEIALLVAIAALVATVFIVGFAWFTNRAEVRRRFRHAVSGLGLSVAVAAILLAYPIWFFAAGAAHLSGSVWTTNVPGQLGNTIGNLWDSIGHYGPISTRFLAAEGRLFGGFAGQAGPSPAYLGWGLLAVLAVGVIIWHRDRRLWLFGALGVTIFAISLQVGPHRWGPWSVLYHLPILLNVVQYRFASIFVLCATTMLGIIVDRCHTSVGDWLAEREGGRRPTLTTRDHVGCRRRATVVLAVLVVTAVALVPEIRVLSPNLPTTMRPVTVPRWFTAAAPQLPSGAVLATYPFPTADSQASIPWQAISGMPYQMAGGGGPAGTVARAGAEKPGFDVLHAASVPDLPDPDLDRSNLNAVRTALRAWQVTTVVVPQGAGLPSFQIGRGTPYGVAFFTAVLGSSPVLQDAAWVWTDVRQAPPPVPVAPGTLSSCLASDRAGGGRLDPWAPCVLNGGPRPELVISRKKPTTTMQ